MFFYLLNNIKRVKSQIRIKKETRKKEQEEKVKQFYKERENQMNNLCKALEGHFNV